jgi:hypothetical protein
MSEACERPCPCAASGSVLVHGDVALPVKGVPEAPVRPRQREQTGRRGFGLGEAGDEIGDLGAGLGPDLARGGDAHNLGRARLCERSDDFGTDLGPPNLDAAMRLVDPPGTLQIVRP